MVPLRLIRNLKLSNLMSFFSTFFTFSYSSNHRIYAFFNDDAKELEIIYLLTIFMILFSFDYIIWPKFCVQNFLPVKARIYWSKKEGNKNNYRVNMKYRDIIFVLHCLPKKESISLHGRSTVLTRFSKPYVIRTQIFYFSRKLQIARLV